MESNSFKQHAISIMEEMKTHLRQYFTPLGNDIKITSSEELDGSLKFIFDATFAFESGGKPVHRLGTPIILYMRPPYKNKIEVVGKSFKYPDELTLIIERIKELKRR